MRERIKRFLLGAVKFILNPRLLLCFGIAWMITNGWSYVMLAVGTYFGIPWMIAVASAYLTVLWLPSPEKIVTCAIAILLLRLLFPRDKLTLGVLQDMRRAAIEAFRNRKRKKQKMRESEIDPDKPEQNGTE